MGSSEPGPPRSLAARITAPLTAIEPREAPAVAAAFCLFFCVLGGYFAVRPVRDTVGTVLGADRVSDLWLVTWGVSMGIIPVYGLVVARIRRSVFLPWTYGLVAVALALVGVALGADDNVAAGQFFYVFISVLNLFLISVFWSFLLELFDSGRVKRLFGVIAAGGTAGALAGPLFTDLTVATIGSRGILFVGAALFAAAIVWQQVLLNVWRASRVPSAAGEDPEERDRAIGGNPFAGVTLVLRSPYLLAIALFVVLLATANTFLYFEQLRVVEVAFPDPDARTRVFARMDWVVQSLTIVSQIFLTGRIAARGGLTMLLSIVPFAMIFGFIALAAWNTFAVLAVVYVTRRFGEYAFVRPGREMLFSPFDRQTKYKAKNFIDVPVYRGADALVAQAQRGIEGLGFGVQTLALLGAASAVLWAFNGWWLGRSHDLAAADRAASVRMPPARPAPARP